MMAPSRQQQFEKKPLPRSAVAVVAELDWAKEGQRTFPRSREQRTSRMRIAREYPVFASTGFQGGSVKGRLAGKVLVGASWIDSSPCMFFVPDID